MAKHSPTGGGPNFETITSNRLAIERGSLIAGNISFQIRNIASLLVSTIETKINIGALILGAAIGALPLGVYSQTDSGFFVGGLVGLGIAAFIVRDSFTPDYQLLLLTNAATSFRIIHKDEQFLLRLKKALEEVMQRGDNSIAYHVNIAEQKIERLEANTTHVSHSPGAAVIGGSATNVSQSTNVRVQGLQDIDALLRIVEQSNNEYLDFFEFHLRVVQQYLGGARTKEEAKSSWAKFIEHAGLIAKAGNNVWELIARIGVALT